MEGRVAVRVQSLDVSPRLNQQRRALCATGKGRRGGSRQSHRIRSVLAFEVSYQGYAHIACCPQHRYLLPHIDNAKNLPAGLACSCRTAHGVMATSYRAQTKGHNVSAFARERAKSARRYFNLLPEYPPETAVEDQLAQPRAAQCCPAATRTVKCRVKCQPPHAPCAAGERRLS